MNTVDSPRQKITFRQQSSISKQVAVAIFQHFQALYHSGGVSPLLVMSGTYLSLKKSARPPPITRRLKPKKPGLQRIRRVIG
ncbi:hypothetical protein [Erwinia psidii]|uniref:hypothetical protein n=1 Tax=Erwinia psidii TaxID=69224 RepID=UPI000F54963E|nr:hypothetical protein [Erwinia psidii]MCX8957659.1 hypothetical protein [Erwinia psidii]MCX8960713.1 hypothetical protein [Erwinia psidii]MCX8964042.1 hypothetical protein [Erwinia psidii]